jgi:hypothetical protein
MKARSASGLELGFWIKVWIGDRGRLSVGDKKTQRRSKGKLKTRQADDTIKR